MEQNLESITVDQLQELMKSKYRFDDATLSKFKIECIDGFVLSIMDDIPVLMEKNFANLQKFKKMFFELTGRTLGISKFQQHNIQMNSTVVEESTNSIENLISIHEILNNNLEDTEVVGEDSEEESEESNTNSNILSNTTNLINSEFVPFPAPLPRFPADISKNLTNGNPFECFNEMIRLVSDFYSNHPRHTLNHPKDYKNVCSTLLDMYLALNSHVINLCNIENARRTSNKKCMQPFRLISKHLSKRMRNLRSGKLKIYPQGQKAVQIERANSATSSFFEKNEILVHNFQNFGYNEDFKTEFRNQFLERREYIHSSNKKLHEILDEFKFYENKGPLILEFTTIVKQTEIELFTKLENFFKILAPEFGFEENMLDNQDLIYVFKKLENRLSKNSLIKQFEGNISDAVDVQSSQTPRIFCKSIDKALYFYFVNGKQILQEIDQNVNFLNILILFFAYYFVFNIKYPNEYEKILGLFHEGLKLEESLKLSSKRSLSYLKYLNKIL